MTARAAKLRLDQLPVERGLADSGAKAQALVLAGRVFRGQQRLGRPGALLPVDDQHSRGM